VETEILLPFLTEPPIFVNSTKGQIVQVFEAYTFYQPLELVFNLTGGNLVVGQNLTLSVTIDMPASLLGAYDNPVITVSLDNALVYPFTTKQLNWAYLQSCPPMDISCFLNTGTPSFDRLVFNTNQSTQVNGMGPWTESQEIEYTVAGSFAATVNIFPPIYSRASEQYGFVQTFHTPTLYAISSQETIISQRNGLLTTALTFFILGVAALEVRSHSDRSDSEQTKWKKKWER
jgi:hypothetical protein